MGCFGDREKGAPNRAQRWESITLSDFKATSAWSSIAYVWLWILFISTIVIYAVDTFTAVNLLLFDRWSSQVKPAIPLYIAKWIFAGCILFSWALWLFEWIRAIRVIRRGGVAESYMDPLAVELQSMRSQGWRRFLVFAELTKSKKGVDLIAFFVYFAFKGAIRIVLAEGPRQVVNILTLLAVIKADFIENNAHQKDTGISLFWANMQKLYNADHWQAIILIAMLYSLAIWAISVICLGTAALFYIIFLWHYIPSHEGGVGSFCRRKIDRRLDRIVEAKVKAGIEEEERLKRKTEEKEWKAGQKAEMKRQKTGDLANLPPTIPKVTRQPTLPQLDDPAGTHTEDKLPEFALVRQNTATTVSTLPPYPGGPPPRNELGQMQRQPTLPTIVDRPPPPFRSMTQDSSYSNSNYEPDAPLLANAGYAGGAAMPTRPPTSLSRQDSNFSGRHPPPRNMTPGSQGAFTPFNGPRTDAPPFQRPYSPISPVSPVESMKPHPGFGPRMPVRTNSPFRGDGESQQYGQGRPYNGAPPLRQNTQSPFDRPPTSLSRQINRGSEQSFSRPLPVSQRSLQDSVNPRISPSTMTDDRSQSSHDSYEMKENPSFATAPATNERARAPNAYVAFNPSLRSASPAPTVQSGPQRNLTAPTTEHYGQVQREVPQRSVTAPIADHRGTIGYSDILDDYDSHDSHDSQHTLPPQRSATAAPHHDGWNNRF